MPAAPGGEARREAQEAQAPHHELCRSNCCALSQLAEQTPNAGQIDADLAESTQLDDLQERRAITGEARFEELDLQLADAQEKHASWKRRDGQAERAWPRCASSSAWSARPRRPSSAPALAAGAAANCSAASRRRSRPSRPC